MSKALKSQILAWRQSRRRPCTSCGEIKPFEDFSRSTKDKLGVRGRCKLCTSGAERTRYDPAKSRERGEAYRAKHPEKARERVQLWRDANRERFRASSNAYNERNRERVRATAKRSHQKRSHSVGYRLNASMKAGIHARLTKGKSGVSTFAALGYTVDDLRLHLESLFADGMSWSNYGRGGWEIDHIIPLSALPAETITDPNFRRAWALANLQPLWLSENRSKGAKLLAAADLRKAA